MPTLKTRFQAVIDAIPIGIYCSTVNFLNKLKGRPARLYPCSGDKLHSVRDQNDEITICRRGRHRRYKRGVMAGVDGLARQYNLNKADITPGGVFVDCGANVGELGIWARKRGMSYLPIEPEPLEADCTDLNNFEGESGTLRCVLWKEETSLSFYSKPGTADSSVIDMGADSKVTIEARTLDSLDALAGSTGTNIFKVEAEGAEPEVLEGAGESLRLFDYVAVDCGYERGVSQDHTFIAVNKALSRAGFEPVEAAFHRVTMLYKNTAR